MAISHTLFLAARQPADTVAAAVVSDAKRAGLIAINATGPGLTGDGVGLRSGVRMHLSTVRSNPDAVAHPVLADLHLAADTKLSFRETGSKDRQPQTDEMLRITLDTLRRYAGDAVLEFQLEVIRLLRRDATIWLGDDPTFWTPARLLLVTEPHQWMPNRFPGS